VEFCYRAFTQSYTKRESIVENVSRTTQNLFTASLSDLELQLGFLNARISPVENDKVCESNLQLSVTLFNQSFNISLTVA